MSTFTELKTTTSAEVVSNSSSTAPAPGQSTSDANGSTAAAISALSRVAAFVPSLDSMKDRFGTVWARSRPWGEFMNTAQMNKPQFSELFDRIKENAEYYAFNYLVVLLCLSALTILTSPLAFLGGLFIVFMYVYLFFLNPEPFHIAGMTIDNNIKAVVIMLFSLVVLWLTGAGATFTTLVVVVGIIAITHASIRRPPGEADFETEYTPATV